MRRVYGLVLSLPRLRFRTTLSNVRARSLYLFAYRPPVRHTCRRTTIDFWEGVGHRVTYVRWRFCVRLWATRAEYLWQIVWSEGGGFERGEDLLALWRQRAPPQTPHTIESMHETPKTIDRPADRVGADTYDVSIDMSTCNKKLNNKRERKERKCVFALRGSACPAAQLGSGLARELIDWPLLGHGSERPG